MTKDRALVMVASLIDAIETSLDEAYLCLVDGDMGSSDTFDNIEDALFCAQDDLCTLVGWESATRPEEPVRGTDVCSRDDMTYLRSTVGVARGLLDQVSGAFESDAPDVELIDEDLRTIQECVTSLGVFLGTVWERTSEGEEG